MVTLVSHISDYFEQFNSSLTADLKSTGSSAHVPTSSPLPAEKIPLSFYVFDFERASDQMGTLHDLRTFMIQHWHYSCLYALAYLLIIYSKRRRVGRVRTRLNCSRRSSRSDLYEG